MSPRTLCIMSDPSFSAIDMSRLPQHVAVIMDGNGRWAKKRNLDRLEGHRAGVTAVRETVTACRELGIRHLTLYALSQENLRRPQREISALMDLLFQYLLDELPEMLENGIGLDTVGDWLSLRDDVVERIKDVQKKTAHGKVMTLHLALNYGSRAEIIRACDRLVKKALSGELEGDVTEELFIENLFTADIPDPDLLIRTSGEYRLSNFLLWQSAYSELFFTPVLWPDFRREHIVEAILDYQQRERRFGMTGEQIKSAGDENSS